MGKFKTQVIINCKFLFINHICFIVNSTWDKILYITIKSKINLIYIYSSQAIFDHFNDRALHTWLPLGWFVYEVIKQL